MKDKAFLTLIGVFFVVLIAGFAIITIDQPTSSITNASTAKPHPLKSFVVAYPQVGVAGDENSTKKPTKLKVTVTLLDASNNIIPNRQVRLTADLGSVIITPSDTIATNATGQAQFFLTSTSPGKATLTATDILNNVAISQIPTVEFTQ